MENKEELHKLSHSKLATFNSCPWKYKLKYIDKIKLSKPSIHAIFGTVTHKVIQEWLTVIYTKSEKEGMKINFRELFKDYLKEELIKESEKEGINLKEYFTKEQILDFYEGTINLLYYLRKKRSSYFTLKGWELVGVEIPLECEYEHNGKTILFGGFIDLILKNKKTNVYEIIDLKTSKSGWYDSQKKDPMKKAQVHFYKHFYSKQFNVSIDKIKVYFLILKREPYVFQDMPLKYISKFVPAAGTVSVKKSLKIINNYINNIFKDDTSYIKIDTDCRFCEYNSNNYCNKSERITLIDLQKSLIINNKKV